MPVTIAEVITSTPSRSNWWRALTDDSGVIAGNTRVVPSIRISLRAWIDPSEIAREHAAGNFGERSGQFDAGRSGTDDHERHPFECDFGVRFALCGLVRDQDAPADFERILERLQTGRVAFPCVMAEVGMRRAARDDQVVITDFAVIQDHLAREPVNRFSLAQNDFAVRLAPQDSRRIGLAISLAFSAAVATW